MSNNASSVEQKNQKKYQSPLLVAFILLLIGTSISVHQFKVPPIMDQIASDVGLSSFAAPWLMSIFTLICLIFAVPAGTLVQKMRSKQVLTLACLLVVIGAVLGALSTSAVFLLISRGIEGGGFLLMSVAGPVAATKHSHPAKLGLVIGIFGVWISTGQILAFNTTPTIFAHLQWRGVWWVYAAFTVVALLVFLLGFRSNEEKQTITATEQEPQARLVDALRNRNLILPSVGFFVYNFCLMIVVTFFPTYATEQGLMPLSQASFIASLPMIFCLIGSPVLGRLSDSFGHKKLFALALLCGGIGATLMFTGSFAFIIIGTCLLGFVGAATPGLMFSSIRKLVPAPKLIAQSNGVAVLFQNAGMFFASLIFGPIVSLLGGSYSKAAIIMLVLSIVSAILVVFTKYNENTTGKTA